MRLILSQILKPGRVGLGIHVGKPCSRVEYAARQIRTCLTSNSSYASRTHDALSTVLLELSVCTYELAAQWIQHPDCFGTSFARTAECDATAWIATREVKNRRNRYFCCNAKLLSGAT